MIKDAIRAVSSLPSYKEVPSRTLGRAVGYLAALGAVYGLVSCIAVFIHLRPKIVENAEWLAQSMPEMTLSGGRLQSTRAGIVEIKHPGIPNFLLIVDTERSESVTPAEMKNRGAAVYLASNSVYIFNERTNNFRSESFKETASVQGYKIGPDFYRNLGRSFTIALYPISIVLCAVWFFVFKLVAALVYTLVAMLINGYIQGGLEFEELYKVSVYAMTPVIVIQMALRLAKGPFLIIEPIPRFFVLALIIVGVYIWQALRQIRPEAGESRS